MLFSCLTLSSSFLLLRAITPPPPPKLKALHLWLPPLNFLLLQLFLFHLAVIPFVSLYDKRQKPFILLLLLFSHFLQNIYKKTAASFYSFILVSSCHQHALSAAPQAKLYFYSKVHSKAQHCCCLFSQQRWIHLAEWVFLVSYKIWQLRTPPVKLGIY